MTKVLVQKILAGVGFAVMMMMAVSPSFAADMPVKARPAPVVVAATTWTGCYIGANVGGGWSDSTWVSANGTTVFDYTADGIVGGGQVGCDWQSGQFVFGVQGMLDASGIKGTGNIVTCCNTFAETKIAWFATLTGRLGYAVAPNWLLYVKGGGAWARSDYRNVDIPSGFVNGADKQTRSGWTFGGGMEWMFAPRWSAFVEYSYIDLKKEFAPLNFFNIEQNVQVVLVGVNYRFGGGPVVARY